MRIGAERPRVEEVVRTSSALLNSQFAKCRSIPEGLGFWCGDRDRPMGHAILLMLDTDNDREAQLRPRSLRSNCQYVD